MIINIDNLLRDNIKNIVPYSTARDESKGKKVEIFLDANENPYNTALNRYPDPKQQKLKEKIVHNQQISIKNLFLGNGSDEVIDLLVRAFCTPGKDKIMIHPPTYGMYQVAAQTNDNEVVKINLTPDFQLDVEEILKQSNDKVKIFFICSPNNPTGNTFKVTDIERLLTKMNAIIVVDEAYVNFSEKPSWTKRLLEFPNLVVMQTLSKAWGVAGIRLGMGYASERIVQVLNSIKLPYNLNTLTQETAINVLDNIEEYRQKVETIKAEREKLFVELGKLPVVQKVYPSDANYILCKFNDANATYDYLMQKGIIVRNRSTQPNCENCLRITVGTPSDNEILIKHLRVYFI
ncbi:MAG: histidinol-phosphate transaminase [Bacteroidales bacterium]|nr:histidinol-phosphate transaminase [Bacteroidales bacterium]